MLLQQVPFPPAGTFQAHRSSFGDHLSTDVPPLRITTGLSVGESPQLDTLIPVFRYQRVIFKSVLPVLFLMVLHPCMHPQQHTADSRSPPFQKYSLVRSLDDFLSMEGLALNSRVAPPGLITDTHTFSFVIWACRLGCLPPPSSRPPTIQGLLPHIVKFRES